jgi:hypothetical protein
MLRSFQCNSRSFSLDSFLNEDNIGYDNKLRHAHHKMLAVLTKMVEFDVVDHQPQQSVMSPLLNFP